ncbi:MAG: peptidase C14 caspase catalytic subunit p20, partial [Bacteroidetes bacterium]
MGKRIRKKQNENVKFEPHSGVEKSASKSPTMKHQLFALSLLLSSSLLSAQCLSGDCQNGTGIFQLPDGSKYIGQFQDGEIHGIGTCYYPDGSKYQGEWAHRFPEGRGTLTLPDGRQWTGLWKQGQPVDEAGNLLDEPFAVEQPTQQVQTGCLSGDCQNGTGVFAYPDGSRYEGAFQQGKPHGSGTFHYANGDWFEGHFRAGYKHGKGTLHRRDGRLIHGEWLDGEYVGNPDFDPQRTGCLSGDCQNGTGIFVFPDGSAKYSGSFRNGRPHGPGLMHYANGERYKGEWKDGLYHGRGTLFLLDGTRVSGRWREGQFVGRDDPVTALKDDTRDIARSLQPPPPPPARVKVWALLIGIAAYNHMPPLRYTDDDAYRLYAFLKSPEGGALPDEQIRILIDEDATRQNIENAMRELFTRAGPNDLVFLYFSGHGLKGSFLPIDFDGYANKLEHDTIRALLAQSPAKYKLCIADACHSGSLLAARSATVDQVLRRFYTNLAQAAPGTALIMSSKADENSLESKGLRQGVFSHFLIRGLKGEADADLDGAVSVQELYEFVRDRVSAYTAGRQSPVILGDYDPHMTVSVLR